jgi:hypothetical protein
MPSTFTTNLGIEKPATGEQAGSWGATANTSYDTIDTAIGGSLQATISASVYQLVTNNGGAPSAGVNKLVVWTGAQTQAGTVQIVPNTTKKIYIMQNKTTGGFALNFQQGSGTQFVLQPGYSAVIYSDGAGNGANVGAALDSPQFNNALFTGNVTINGALAFGAAQTFAQSVTFSGAVNLNGPTTTVANLIVNPSGYTPHAWDLYYRVGASGILAPLAIGTPGQVLGVASGPALAWTTLAGLAVGSPISGSTPYAIYYASASNALAQDSTILINPTVGIGVGVLPGHSLHLGYSRAPEVWLDTNDSTKQQREVVWASNGVARWNLFSPMLAEGGSNTGSNFQLLAYNDPANATRSVIFCTRANGNVTIGPPGGDQAGRLVVIGDNAAQAVVGVRGASGQTAALQVWQNSGSTGLSWIDAAGAFNGPVAATSVSASSLSVSGNATVSGSFSAGSLSISALSANTVDVSGLYSITGQPGITTTLNYVKPSSGVTGGMTFKGGILISWF